MTESTARQHLTPVDGGEAEPETPEVASERAVLGRAIQSSAAAADALALLRPEHFTKTAHQVVFEAVERLADAGSPVEPASVLSEIARAGMLARVGAPGLGTGGVFLASLMERAGDIGFHAPRILGEWQRVGALRAVESAAEILKRPGFDPDVHLEQVRKTVDDATASDGARSLRFNSEAVYEVLASLDDGIAPGLATGLPDLDEAIGGLRDGELIVIGARPGQGKSLLSLCIADHVGTNLGLPVLFASLEMSEFELTQRRMAAAAKVPLTHIVRHQVTDADCEKLDRAMPRLGETKLIVDDTPQASLGYIRGRLRHLARTGRRARVLVIDYLGYVDMPSAESRQQAVAAAARGAKNIALEFRIPVVLLAQLNRDLEKRSDRRPGSADLRESGEIEQSANVIILLHRPDAGDPESTRAGEIDLLVTKNRQGALCTVTLLFQGHYGRVVSLSHEWSSSKHAEDQ